MAKPALLKSQGNWQTFLRAHWRAIVAADFFTTEVWTTRAGDIYTVFTIELCSRRVQILGSTPHPDESFMLQIARHVTDLAELAHAVAVFDVARC